MAKNVLFDRRTRALGPCYFHFYEDPLHLVRGEGMWVWDAKGRKYLDCYNNVPSVGHCHPHVVEALHRQASLLNVSTRYLDDNIVTFAERLLDKLPAHLDTCMFVCTGTEANDLAVQMAREYTGHRGCIVNECSYHGNSALVKLLSTSAYDEADRPGWLGTVEPPNLYRGPHSGPDAGERYAEMAGETVDAMVARGVAPAVLLLEAAWDSPGPHAAPENYARRLCQRVRDAGGLIIADEVQAGFCRLGELWWGFEHYGVEPDMVTLGKPTGDGHPIGAVIARREIVERFAAKHTYFNTFGGNPVSAAVGNAVLDAMEAEDIPGSVKTSSHYLEVVLRRLQDRHESIGAVQGRGLLWGLDLVSDRRAKTPISNAALRRVTSLIAQEGVLVGTSGRHQERCEDSPAAPLRANPRRCRGRSH